MQAASQLLKSDATDAAVARPLLLPRLIAAGLRPSNRLLRHAAKPKTLF